MEVFLEETDSSKLLPVKELVLVFDVILVFSTLTNTWLFFLIDLMMKMLTTKTTTMGMKENMVMVSMEYTAVSGCCTEKLPHVFGSLNVVVNL